MTSSREVRAEDLELSESGGTRAAPAFADMIAADIMTEAPYTMRPIDTISQAVEALQSMNVRHLPIVDESGQLVGMLSDRDLGPFLRTLTKNAEVDNMVVPLSQRPIADFMSTDVVSVELDADVRDVVEIMLGERIGAVPVVDADGSVAGIISYVDVLRTLTGDASATQRSHASSGSPSH